MSLDASELGGTGSVLTGAGQAAGAPGGATLVHGSVPGIAVDNTDPLNPIVSNTGVVAVSAADGSIVLGGTSTNRTFAAVNIQPVANYAAAGALPMATMPAGSFVFVISSGALFQLKASTAALRTNFRIAASGKAGFQLVRVLVRDAVAEVQATWFVDPTNSTGTASDDNSGIDLAHALRTYQELSWRLWTAEINQVTTVTCGPGDQQALDNPTFSYIVRGLVFMSFVATPTVLFTSTVTGYVAAAFGATAADDCQFSDTAVPGGTFTAAGALAKGVMIKRTNGTVIYAPVLKDLGGTTCRVGQPHTLVPAGNIAFAVGDTYQLISLPKLISIGLPAGGNIGQSFTLFDWKVPPNSTNGCGSTQFITCYFENNLRSVGGEVFTSGSCFDTGGGSFESGGPVRWSMPTTAFKGTGATRYSFSGWIGSEGGVTSLQGCQFLFEQGCWNMGQLAVYDWTGAGGAPGAITAGTGGRVHFVAPISGKGSTSKLVCANNGSQVVVQGLAIGAFYTPASTTDATPIQAGATTSTDYIPLQADMNGVLLTA